MSSAATMLHEDCSSNARSDTLDKYSRFFGKSEFSDWCNEPTLKYTEGFRDLIYQINPHYISCVYKKMFDFCSTNQLRIVDDDGVVDDEREHSTGNSAVLGLANSNQENTTPRNVQIEPVDRSNSCVYSQTNCLGAQNCVKNTTDNCKKLCGWFICQRPHSASCTLYQTLSGPEIRDTPYRRTTYNRVLSPGTFHDSLRSPGTFQESLRSGTQSPARKCRPVRFKSAQNSESSNKMLSRDGSVESGGGRQCGVSASCFVAVNSPIKVGRTFRHFKRGVSYIDQYREEYTYRKLYALIQKNGVSLPAQRSDCQPEKQPCNGFHSQQLQQGTNCTQRWYPQQSHPTEKSRSVASGIHSPKWPHPLKTISQHSMPKSTRVPVHVLQIPQLEGVQRKGVPWANELKQKVGFFATSLTIKNYNPTKPPSVVQHPSCSSSPMPSVAPSKSGGSVKGDKPTPSTLPIQDRHLNQNVKSVR